MNQFQTMFFSFITFITGGMCFVNLSLLMEVNPNYEASWVKVSTLIIMAMISSALACSERR